MAYCLTSATEILVGDGLQSSKHMQIATKRRSLNYLEANHHPCRLARYIFEALEDGKYAGKMCVSDVVSHVQAIRG